MKSSEADAPEFALAQSYDISPYFGNPYCQTHPGVLAAYGVIYGLSPSDPCRSRVLELGCGDGGNLIPMAYEFPRCKFFGIDLSPIQIGIGQKNVDALGLKNIRLNTRSIMDMGTADGKFDYIIAHGVYSWVSTSVREKILEICRGNLSDHGIAYISYNVLPGWRFNQSMRDMILYRTRKMEDPKQRVAAVLDIFGTMLAGLADGDSTHDAQFKFFGKTLESIPDVSAYLLHEYMEAENNSFYFHEFATDLQKHSLQYICDAEQQDFELDALPADTGTKFEAISENTIEVEQYIDFLKNTRFRRSLVCHEGIDLDSAYRLDRIQNLHAATDVLPILRAPDDPAKETTAYRTPTGRRFSTQHPLAQLTLRLVSDIRPCSMSVGALIEAVSRETESGALDMSKQAEKIGHAIYSLFFNGVLELLGAGRRCVPDTGELPMASPVSRLLAPSRRMTNLCHRTIMLDDDMAYFVLAHLDGARNRDALCDLMTEAVRSGQVQMPSLKSKRLDDIRISMRDRLGSILQQLPRCGVMIKN
jgi:methyltransferase-like protein